MSTNCSALWSSLRTLELTSQFASTPVERTDQKHHKRHQKLASALAHIGATSSDAKTVTACSVELLYSEGGDNHSILIRVAQNKKVQRKEIEQLQRLVDGLVKEVSAIDESEWSTKDERSQTIHSIVQDFLLPIVVKRCQDKISHILNGPYSKPFRDWYADITKSNTFEGIPDVHHAMLLGSLKLISDCSGDDVSKPRNVEDVAMVRSIIASSIIIFKLSDTHENSWTAYDAKVPHDKVADDVLERNVDTEDLRRQVEGRMDVDCEDTEHLDDRESLDPDEIKKSSIYRFLRKLERYYVSCRIITSELVSLVRAGFELNVKVEPVPILTTISTPTKENEYPSFEDFFTQCTRVDQSTLDLKKVGSLRESWPQRWQSQNLFLHAEMQIAMFYALNPHLSPIQGFIGVSKKCCWCCDFVLNEQCRPSISFIPPRAADGSTRSLQISDEMDRRYNKDVAGPPLFFSVQGTHNRRYTAWVFPDPSKHFIRQPDVLCQASFDKICHRFRLVREDLEKALVSEVNGIVEELQISSDSNGMDDEWEDHSMRWDLLLKPRKRKRKDQHQDD